MASYGFPMVWKVQSAWLKRSMVLSWAIYWGPCSCSHCWAECIWAADSAAPKAFREHQRTAMLRHVKTVSDSIHHVHVMQPLRRFLTCILWLLCACAQNSTQVYTFLQKQQSQFDSPTICISFWLVRTGLVSQTLFQGTHGARPGPHGYSEAKEVHCQSPGPCKAPHLFS